MTKRITLLLTVICRFINALNSSSKIRVDFEDKIFFPHIISDKLIFFAL
jgi:hypothetical protein